MVPNVASTGRVNELTFFDAEGAPKKGAVSARDSPSPQLPESPIMTKTNTAQSLVASSISEHTDTLIQQTEACQSSQMNRDPLRVLNLEADPGDHELIRRHAVSTGLSVNFIRVANRAEYEAALKRGDIDLILADHCIPGYDGIAALESAQSLRPGVPYIIVSDSAGDDQAAECIRRGASDFVHKDRLERLPAAIARATQKPGGRQPSLEAGEEFREIAENIRDVFWVCEAGTGRALYVSPAYEAIWGKQPDALISEQSVWPEAVVEEDREAVLKARGKLDAGAPYQVEYRIQRPDKSVRWIEERGFPVPAKGGGRSARTVGVAADITERKLMEADRLQRQKAELVGKLAAGIAHDFNNLLTIISGNVLMLLDKGSLPPEVSEALKAVFTASRQATDLVRQLLLFRRRRSLTLEVIDLNTEIDLIAGELRLLLGETIVVEIQPSPDSPRVSADVGMLEQLLTNLAINARDAMARSGRLTIAVGLRPCGGERAREQRSARVEDYACLTVRDTGCGIPAPILPRIFEPFFTTKEEGRGTGLGLAIGQDIVKRHDGWIEVETEVGVGTEFRIYLPLTRSETTTSSLPDQRPVPRTGKATVLLVEDESGVREFAATVLQQDGYRLLQAKSADSALEVWRRHSARVDLLLADVVLPGDFSGLQLSTKLQAEKPALKVILTTTGYGNAAIAQQSADGASHFVLLKPYTPRSLLRAVHDVLAR